MNQWLRLLVVASIALWAYAVLYDANHLRVFTLTTFLTDTATTLGPAGIVFGLRWVFKS